MMKATVAFVVVWCLLVSPRPAAAQEPIESRSLVSEPVGLIAASDNAPRPLRSYAMVQMSSNGGGISTWKVLVIGIAVVAVILAVRATTGNTPYHTPHE
jgi:hypothetical protein